MRLSMSRSLLFAFACLCVTAMVFEGSALFAADPANPLTNGGSNNAAGQGTSLNLQQLGDALSSYEKNTITDNGQTIYSITVPRGKWNLNFIISLSPNGSVIWMTNGLTQMPDAKKVSVDALANVLKKNTEIGPIFFSIAGDSLRMNDPVPNFNLTPEKLKQQIDDLAKTVTDTADLWSTDTLSGTAAPNAHNPLSH
jgi:hypothetical protein